MLVEGLNYIVFYFICNGFNYNFYIHLGYFRRFRLFYINYYFTYFPGFAWSEGTMLTNSSVFFKLKQELLLEFCWIQVSLPVPAAAC